MKLRVFFTFAVVLSTMTVVKAQSIGIATNAGGGMYYSSGTALAKAANDKAGLRATIQPFAGVTVYTPAVSEGEPQFGFGNVYETILAYEGKEHFAGRPTKDLRAVAIAYPRMGIYVKKNSSFRKIADLKGHPAPDGYTAQKTMQPVEQGRSRHRVPLV